MHDDSAAAAGALASWITNPVDLVRLRLQVQRGSEANPGAGASGDGAGGKAAPRAAGGGGGAAGPEAAYLNTLDGLAKVYRREGVAGLFKGSGARIAFFTPSTMISMSLYDELKKIFHEALG